MEWKQTDGQTDELVMNIARRGLKVKVIGQGHGRGSGKCGRFDLDREHISSAVIIIPPLSRKDGSGVLRFGYLLFVCLSVRSVAMPRSSSGAIGTLSKERKER